VSVKRRTIERQQQFSSYSERVYRDEILQRTRLGSRFQIEGGNAVSVVINVSGMSGTINQ